MATKPHTTRTLGPLHLEDLEPHRFEDLIRQLIYDFRPWRAIEATGRGGGDDGFDARAWEIVGETRDVVDDDADDDTDAVADRQWLIQCKRERAITPKKLEGYVEAIPTEERDRIYGVIFAAACDFSKTARDKYREKVRALGFAEAYLWGKAEIEDALFQPKNDHLLFAYFGISLQARRRSLRSDVRARLAAKRKVKRAGR
ncbi:MAG: restriction endonuclease [Pseudomonadota bacterium]